MYSINECIYLVFILLLPSHQAYTLCVRSIFLYLDNRNQYQVLLSLMTICKKYLVSCMEKYLLNELSSVCGNKVWKMMKGIIFKFQAVTFLLINPNLQQDNDGPPQITAVITLWCLNHPQHDSLPEQSCLELQTIHRFSQPQRKPPLGAYRRLFSIVSL